MPFSERGREFRPRPGPFRIRADSPELSRTDGGGAGTSLYDPNPSPRGGSLLSDDLKKIVEGTTPRRKRTGPVVVRIEGRALRETGGGANRIRSRPEAVAGRPSKPSGQTAPDVRSSPRGASRQKPVGFFGIRPDLTVSLRRRRPTIRSTIRPAARTRSTSRPVSIPISSSMTTRSSVETRPTLFGSW